MCLHVCVRRACIPTRRDRAMIPHPWRTSGITGLTPATPAFRPFRGASVPRGWNGGASSDSDDGVCFRVWWVWVERASFSGLRRRCLHLMSISQSINQPSDPVCVPVSLPHFPRKSGGILSTFVVPCLAPPHRSENFEIEATLAVWSWSLGVGTREGISSSCARASRFTGGLSP